MINENIGAEPTENLRDGTENPEGQPDIPQDDTLAEFAKLEAEKIQIQKERDNYRKAYLKKARGEEVEEPTIEDETEDERIRRLIREEQLSSKEAENARKLEETNQKILKENAELKKAFLNRSQISSSSIGSNMDKPEVKGNSIFSPEQEAELRQRANKLGINPDEYIQEVVGNLGNPFGLKDILTKRT